MRITLLFCLAVALCGLGCGSDGEQGPAGAEGADGADGATTLVSTTAEPAGENCDEGGVRIEAGTDENSDGSLDADEVQSTSYVCNGPTGDEGMAGDDGEPGNDGFTSLVATSDEPAGANCAEGGVKIEVGIDDDESGTLESGEVDETTYVCNGADGEDGRTALISSTVEPAGLNCPNGGVLYETGLDLDGNGTLESGEVTHSRYICNGVDGEPGATGPTGPAGPAGPDGDDGLVSLIDVTDEAAGANCQEGGVRIDWGLDDNGNGSLEAAEIDGTSYVCNPFTTLSRYGETSDFGVAGTFTANFLLGTSLDVPQNSILKGFGYWGYDDTTNFRMALYTDSGGEPDQLVAETGPIAMEFGEQEVTIAEANLPAGTYWVMGHYETSSPGVGQGTDSTTIKFISLPFSSDPPQTYPAASTYTGGSFNYWIVATP